VHRCALHRVRDTSRYFFPIRSHIHCATAGGEGSIARIDAAECMRSMTETRARELETQK
jgi:hypothetical protein